MTEQDVKRRFNAVNGIPSNLWTLNGRENISLGPSCGCTGGFWFNAREFRLFAQILDEYAGKISQPLSPGTKVVISDPKQTALVASLKEASLCLSRYCSPGSRGHIAMRKALQALKAAGIDFDPGSPDKASPEAS